MSIRPLNGYVLVKKDEVKEIGGVLVGSEDNAHQSDTGVVVAIGDEIIEKDGIIRCHVIISDHIAYKKYSGHDLKVENESYEIVAFSDILAVI